MKSLIVALSILLSQQGLQNSTNGSVAGTLKLANGGPVAGVRVAAMAVSDAETLPGVAYAFESITESAADGSYKLENLPPGRYYVTAGVVSALTYYPGGFERTRASIINVTAGRALSGYDFIPGAFPIAVKGKVAMTAPAGVSFPTAVILSGEDRLQTAIRGDGTFEFQKVLPGKYTVTTVPEFVGSAGNIVVYERQSTNGSRESAVTIDSLAPQDLALSIAATPLPTTSHKVSGRLANVAREAPPLSGKVIVLSTSMPGIGTFESVIQADNSFEFAKVPAGIYQVSFPGARSLDQAFQPPTVTVLKDLAEVIIDAHNNPFPEYPGGSYAAVFYSNYPVVLRGVVTQAVTQIRPSAPVHYFRMDVTDVRTGVQTPWAIMLTESSPQPLKVGETVTITGTGSRDGTNRISVIRTDERITSGRAVPPR